MNLYSFLRKKHRKPFVGAIFAVVFLSAFFVFQTTAKAQTVTTWEFECLFEPLLTGNTCNHSGTESAIKSGNKSGIAYGKIPAGANYVTDNGVKAITFLVGLTMDPAKAKVGLPGQDKNYFYSRVADKNSGTFVVRIGYKDANNKTVYKLQNIPYTENATSVNTVVIPTGGVPFIFTNADYSTNSSGALVKIPFFTSDGSNIVTREVVQATISAPNSLPEIPYGTEMTADLWYCGGLQNNVSGPEQRDGRYTKKGDRVEYFTPNGRYAYNNNGVITIAYDGTPYPDTVAGLCNSTTENALETQGADAGKKRSINAGTAHYKIGETITFKIPAKADVATDQAVDLDTGIKGTEQVETGDTLPVCVLAHPLTGSGSFMGCIAQAGYYILYYPSAWLAGILGRIMDFFLGYSISDESYRASVVVTGWKLVRDISNIFFIIILIWTGFATVFNISGISMKKVVPTLIINALIINFSLFGTQVVIDISNITARLFYNTMSVCDGKCVYKDPPNEKEIANPNTRTTGGYKPLSEKIVDSFDPQTIFKMETLNANPNSDNNGGVDVTSNNGGFNASGVGNNIDATSNKRLNIYDSDYAGYFLIVSIIAALIMLAMAKMFFGVMFMFVGRVVGLYLTMIFAPFAVVTRGNMPLVGNIKELAWDNWLKDLTNYALMAPIFVFFLYIIYAFINSDMLTIFNLEKDGGFMNTVISIAIPMIIIYMLVATGVKLAKKYAGTAGEMLQKYATTATGLVAGAAVGVASGGVALAGRGAMSALGKTGLSTWAAENKGAGGIKGALAGGTNRFMSWGQKSSMDIRNAGLKIGGKEYTALGSLNSGLSNLGVKLDDKISGGLKLGQKDYIGGNVKIKSEREKKKTERVTKRNDMSHLTDEQVEKVWKKKSEKANNDTAEKAWETTRLQQLKDGEPTLKKLEEAEARLAKDLETAIANKNTTNEKLIRDQIKTNKQEQAAIITMIVEPHLEDEKKNNAHRETELYKENLKKAEEDRRKAYGKVTNAKELSEAMRYEYAQRMLEDSLYLSEGKKRWRLAPGAGGAFGGLGIAAGMTGAGIVSGGLFGNYIDSLQESEKRVFEKITKDYKKAHSPKDNKIVRLQSKLDEIDKFVDDHIKEVLKNTNIKFEDIKEDQAAKDEHFNTARAKAAVNVEEAEDAYNKAKAEYKSNKTDPAKKKAFEEETRKYQQAKDELNDLNNAKRNRDKAQDDLEKEKERVKAEEEKKKGSKDGDKKESEKPKTP